MAKQQFTNLYRPRKISEIVGQKPAQWALSHLLQAYVATGEFPRSIIFQGAHGCGKTTLGRILARYINCELGPVRACQRGEECESCREFDLGTNQDIWECDAATNNSVADVVRFKEWSQFRTKRRKRILILDEAHQMSPQAFNAMLKIVEEGEENVCFVFCTTLVDKIPQTIQSRSTIIPIKPLNSKDLTELARGILAKEGIGVESEEALQLLVRKSKGHARDLIKNLEAAAFYYSEEENLITNDAAYSMNDMQNVGVAKGFIKAAIDRDLAGVIQTIDQSAQDPVGFCKTVIEVLRHELYLRSYLQPTEVSGIKAEDLIRFLAMIEDSAYRVRMGESLATLLVGWERWKLGAYCEI